MNGTETVPRFENGYGGGRSFPKRGWATEAATQIASDEARWNILRVHPFLKRGKSLLRDCARYIFEKHVTSIR